MTVGTWRGALIDDRNVISLSRFQMLIWTTLALSAFMTAAIFNVYIGVDEPLSILVPGQLWTLIGISTASLVAAPMLLNQKKSKEAPDEALEDTKDELRRQGAAPEMVKAEGQVLVNKDPLVAQWSDMLTGGEVSNGTHVDLAKLQMFLFTLLTAFVYGAALLRMFEGAQPDGLTQFPIMDQSIIALIGISHSGYLLNKATPKPTSRP
jgi:hypothetical protein